MNFNGQMGCDQQYDFAFIKTHLPSGSGYMQQTKAVWKSMRLADTPHWTDNNESPLAGSNQEKEQVTKQPSQQRIVLHIDDDEEDRMLLEEALLNL